MAAPITLIPVPGIPPPRLPADPDPDPNTNIIYYMNIVTDT